MVNTSVIGLLIQMSGCVALLLWGTHMVSSGVLRVFGSRLRQKVGASMANPFRAFFTGFGVTLGLQSSTATSMMASSFVARGVLGAGPGYVLMLGANVGTALVAQILSFPIDPLAPLLLLSGWMIFRAGQTVRRKNFGRIAMGLGMMLFSLHEMLSLSSSAFKAFSWEGLAEILQSQPALALIGAMGMAWLCHSSVAVVLLILSLSIGGVLPLDVGWLAILGANLGGAIPPVVEAASVAERRLPLGNLLVRAFGVALGIALSHWVYQILLWRNTPHDLVWAHLIFNLTLAILAFPFGQLMTRLVFNLAPDPPLPDDPGRPQHLSSGKDPILTISSAERESLRVADLVKSVLKDCSMAVLKGDPDSALRIAGLSDASTTLGSAIRGFLVQSDRENWHQDEVDRAREINVFVMNLEHAVDIAEHQLVSPVLRRHREQGRFSKDQQDALKGMMSELERALDLAVAVFMRHDQRAARELVEQKVRGRRQESDWVDARDAEKAWDKDMATDLRAMREARRIYGHLAAIAYEVLDKNGQLQSRVLKS